MLFQKYWFKRGILLCFMSMLVFSSSTLAQTNGSITGTVKEKNTDIPLPGANILIKGTTLGAASGNDGSFTISNVPPGTYSLETSFIGYHKQEAQVTVSATQVTNVNFNLEQDVFNMEEVVVTGIASRSSRAVAEVAVSRVKASDLTVANTYTSVDQLVNGKIAGVYVTKGTGNVSGGFRFNVRSGGGLNGNEQPVIYLDGIRIENDEIAGVVVGGQGVSTLGDINPEDIESIEVLKGPAAAASYGTGGANGVVLIKTKRGRISSEKANAVSLSYKVVRGWNTVAYDFKPEDWISANAVNNTLSTGALIQNSVSASGGSNVLRYFMSFDSRVEEGILLRDKLNRKTARLNFDVIPNDKLRLSANIGYTFNDIGLPINDNGLASWTLNTILRPIPYLRTDSTAIASVVSQSAANRYIGSIQAEWTPITGLSGRVIVGIDESDIRQTQVWPVNQRYAAFQFESGNRRIFTRKSTLFTYTLDGRYTFSPFSDLQVSTVVGTQLFDRRVRDFSTTKIGFESELIQDLQSGGDLLSSDERSQQARSAGIFGETNLALRDQYFVSLGLRRDYSSVIGREAPSIFYPKASLAVRMDKYDWFPSLLNLAKLRVAYGESGVLPGLKDGIPLLYGTEPGGFGIGAVPAQFGNENIKPERIKELELGFDAELGKFALEVTYYRQTANNSIINFLNPTSTGRTASAVPFNVGEMKGSGIETLLQASLIRKRNFGLDITLINNFQENEVTNLGTDDAGNPTQPIFDGANLNVIKVGLPKHEFYVREVLGPTFDPATGLYLGAELGEFKSQGNPIPDYTGSFSVNLKLFKNFNLYVLTDWATGQSIYSLTKRFAYRFNNLPRINVLETQLGIVGLTPRHGAISFLNEPVPGVEQLTPGTPEYQAAAEEMARLDWRPLANFIEEADFFKVRELSLSYSLKDLLPKLSAANKYFKNIIISFSATNLFTATKLNGLPDPEVSTQGARSLSRGQEFGTLQKPRTYNLAFRFSL